MKPLSLRDLVPAKAKFRLANTEREYTLRPISLGDQLWIAETFQVGLEQILAKGMIKEMIGVAFHQLSENDKSDFARREVTVMDNAGEKHARMLGGATLLAELIHGPSEIVSISEALLRTLGISKPIQDEIEKSLAETESDAKKKFSGGVNYSTSSPVSTDGQPSKSSPSRIESSEFAIQQSKGDALSSSVSKQHSRVSRSTTTQQKNKKSSNRSK